MAIAATCFVLPRVQPAFFSLEHGYADWRTALLSPQSSTQDDRIAFVTIGEDVLDTLTYRSPIDRGFLAELVSAVDAASPKVVAIDILIDTPTEPAKDARLADALKLASAPIVLADADARLPRSAAKVGFAREFVAQSMVSTGFVNTPSDEDDVVRSLPASVDLAQPYSFAQVVADKAGARERTLEPTLWGEQIAWRQRPRNGSNPTVEIDALSLMSNPAIAKRLLQDRIVVIGADLPGLDRHKTAFSKLGRKKAGMNGARIHLQMIAQHLDGRRLRLIPPVLEAALYGIAAVAGLWIALTPSVFARKAKLISVLGLVALLLDYLSFRLFGRILPTAMILFCLGAAIAFPGRVDWARGKLAKLRSRG